MRSFFFCGFERRKTDLRKMTDKKLKIKLDAIQRLVKEVEFYKKEMQMQQKKLETMIEERKEVHDINKQKEIVEESENMIPDTLHRLKFARNDLEEFLVMIPGFPFLLYKVFL